MQCVLQHTYTISLIYRNSGLILLVTIMHHKVAARVVCVFLERDVQVTARGEQQSLSGLSAISNQVGSGSNSSNNKPGRNGWHGRQHETTGQEQVDV